MLYTLKLLHLFYIKKLSSNIDDIANELKSSLFFNEIRANFIKNGFNTIVIAGGIIKNKILKLYFLNAIFLNNLHHLLRNNLFHIPLYNFLKTNKHYLKTNIIINVMYYNSNKSNRFCHHPMVKKMINVAFNLAYFFGQ